MVISSGETEAQEREIANLIASKNFPMKRMATVPEVVGAILFLFSSKSAYINGVALPIDGGFSLH
jgi:NAD(P)-dependent dehydrogenase (short-subunit alcohol dehydrogenase family)